jgi:uncharacterized protein
VSTPPETPRRDVEFSSPVRGERAAHCRGWLSLPSGPGPFPLVVMAHGFGGTREMKLTPYAERFVAAGFGTLLFDYRRFGASDGEPRNLMVPRDEVEDWLAALAFARTLPEVDHARIALWGTSFAGGLVLRAAAADGAVAATVSQCPLLDGRAAAVELARYAGALAMLRVSAHGLYDLLRAAVGASPHYMPIVGRPGAVAAMTSADAWDGYTRLAPPDFRNEVSARTGLYVTGFRPITVVAGVRCPALLQICERDTVAPIAAVERAAALMPKAEVVRYPVGHFDVYVGADFERSVSDQEAFLVKHLLGTESRVCSSG